MAYFLVANDEPNIRELYACWLHGLGHASILAHDGEQAERMVNAAEFDVIITNYLMPGCNGLEFLRRVAHRVTSRTPCALDSGYSLSELSWRMAEICMSTDIALWFVPLPFDFRELKRTVEQMLRVRSAYLEPQSVRLQDVLDEPNAEVRRILRQLYGEDRFLADTGAELVDVDSAPVDRLIPGSGTITRALLQGLEGRRFLVASDGSTQRVYYMEVPMWVGTCQEAYEALSGRSGVRTIVEA